MNGMKESELTKACHLQGNVKHIKLELRHFKIMRNRK